MWWGKHKIYMISVLCVVLPISLIFLVEKQFHSHYDGKLSLTVLDVGQGTALFLRLPSGGTTLIDAGPDATLLSSLARVYPWYHKHIDTVILTSTTRGHFEGLLDLLKTHTVGMVFTSPVANTSPEYDALIHELVRTNVSVSPLSSQNILSLGDGVFVEVLFPPATTHSLTPADGALLLRVVYGKTSFLLNTTSPKRIESYVARIYKSRLKSDVLLVGSSGGAASTDQNFVSAVSPTYAVISSIKSEKAPNATTLETLTKAHATIVGTYEKGDSTFLSDGERVEVTGEK